MGFDKYLKKREITKIIDPGQGESPKAIFTTPERSEINNKERDIVVTPLKTTINDLVSLSQSTQQLILDTIENIDSINSKSDDFVKYHGMVKSNHFNPSILINNPNARPKIVYQPNQIKLAERVVYRSSKDPRAPFVQDLYDHLADAGLSEYVLSNYWNRIVVTNGFYDNFDSTNSLPKFAIHKEQQHLLMLRESAERINRNKAEALSYGFLKAFSHKINNQIYLKSPTEQIQQIGKIIQTLKHIRIALSIVSIVNTENWETFTANLKDVYGDFLQLTATKISKISAYSFIGGIQESVFDLLDGFEDLIPFGVELETIPESREFMSQIDNSFSYFLRQIEDDLVYRDGMQTKLEENRQILLLNSRKNSKTNQFMETIDATVVFLEQIRSALTNISTMFSIDTEILTQNLVNNIDSYIRSS